MKAYKLNPLDTLFFRDGSPFNQGETGQMEVTGYFPPLPRTVVGALRANLARTQGWTRRDRDWSQAIKDVLGDGDDLGSLRFAGPYLLKDGEPLFPAPLRLLGKTDTDPLPLTLLYPGEQTLKTDVGEVRLPSSRNAESGYQPLEDYWITGAGMQAVLADNVPNVGDLVRQQQLWRTENRVGIQRNLATRATEEDALYQSSHVRLCSGVGLLMHCAGLPESWAPTRIAPLGGESRAAWLEPTSPLTLPAAPDTFVQENGKLCYSVTLVTPADLSGDDWQRPGGEIEGLPGTVVSACTNKPILVGGWNSVANMPLPLKPLLPAGSTWFMHAEPSDEDNIRAVHEGSIGAQQAWGYGQILIGTWRSL